MDLGQTRRGIFMEVKYLTPTRTTIVYEVRLTEVELTLQFTCETNFNYRSMKTAYNAVLPHTIMFDTLMQ
jgi:hypothetical protein